MAKIDSRTSRTAFFLMILFVSITLSGCVANPKNPDPLEGINRVFFSVNQGLDKFVAKPVSDVYQIIIPEPVRHGFSNILKNLTIPNVALNNLLQGKGEQAGQDALRFLINSTVGIAGIFDVATDMGFEAHEEDFGQTLATWGSHSGPYLVLPLLGPSTVRDIAAIPVNILMNPFFYGSSSITLTAFDGLVKRSDADDKIEYVRQNAIDPYLFIREAYLKHRTFLIHDGTLPPTYFEDFERLR